MPDTYSKLSHPIKIPLYLDNFHELYHSAHKTWMRSEIVWQFLIAFLWNFPLHFYEMNLCPLAGLARLKSSLWQHFGLHSMEWEDTIWNRNFSLHFYEMILCPLAGLALLKSSLWQHWGLHSMEWEGGSHPGNSVWFWLSMWFLELCLRLKV